MGYKLVWPRTPSYLLLIEFEDKSRYDCPNVRLALSLPVDASIDGMSSKIKSFWFFIFFKIFTFFVAEINGSLKQDSKPYLT